MTSPDRAPRRMFGIVGRHTGHLDALCDGPTPDGRCPQTGGGTLPCAGERVIPLSGTVADGLPFSISPAEAGPECPLSWVSGRG